MWLPKKKLYFEKQGGLALLGYLYRPPLIISFHLQDGYIMGVW